MTRRYLTGDVKCVRGFFGELFISIEERVEAKSLFFRITYITYRWRTAKYKDLPAIQRAMAERDKGILRP
jgi:hypothetical protein